VWSLKDAIQGDAQTAELIQAYLRRVGIGAKFVVLDPGFWKAQVTVAPDKAKYDLLNLGWGTFTCDAEYTLNYLFRSDAVPPERRNRMYYRSSAVDRFIELGNTQPTLALRNQSYGQAIKEIFQDAPILQLFQLKEEIAFRNTLHGAQIDPCQLIHPAQFAWKSRP
jgi:ABC-type transport system substrate-binding protein